MHVFLLFLSLFTTVLTKEFVNNCGTSLISKYYAEIGCEVVEFKNEIPVSYDCSKFEQHDAKKCYYLDKSFSVGDIVESFEDGSCHVHCRCSQKEDTSRFSCIFSECAEHFNGPRDPDCRYLYNASSCCSSNSVCGEARQNLPTCTYNNETYVEGEQFYPDNSCLRCICQEGFKGVIEAPFCKEIPCHFDVESFPSERKKECVPVFHEQSLCCNIGWRCPDESDEIKKSEDNVSCSAKTCKFGIHELQQGDRIVSKKQNGFCVCEKPPYVTCFEGSG